MDMVVTCAGDETPHTSMQMVAASAWIRRLLEYPPDDSVSLCHVLRTFLNSAQTPRDPSERRFVLVVRHLAFLLECGEMIYFGCELRRDSWLNDVLFIQRVALEDGLLYKTVARFSCVALAHDPLAFHEYIEGPSIVIYKNSIMVEYDAGESGVPVPVVQLTGAEVVEIYRAKQRLADLIGFAKQPDAPTRRYINDDISLIHQAYVACVRGARLAPATRASHPYRPAQLSILPRLIRAPHGKSILRLITEHLPVIGHVGFQSIMLAPVDRQSTHIYYGETIDGRLLPYVNNHGYWCSGEVGIDPLLGSEQDYRELVSRADAAGIGFTQDCVIGTLGYPAQLSKFSAFNAARPTALVMGGEAIDVWDKTAFLHEYGPGEDGGLEGNVTPEHYSQVLSTLHRGSFFELPRPNLFDEVTRRRSIARSSWLAEKMKVQSFRIDMAKHIGAQPLSNILDDLRRAVADPAGFSAVLEYWTTHYRDLHVATQLLAGNDAAVYFYDFPLAAALQRILVHGAGFNDTLKGLQCERSAWDIDLRRFVPTFVDHDAYFTPLYDGSASSRSMVLCGYALCMMMSANAPCVYFGFDNARAGASLSAFHLRSERTSRRAVDGIFCADDYSPLRPVGRLLKLLDDLGVLENWDGKAFVLAGAADQMEIARGFIDRASGRRHRLRARFAKNGQSISLAAERILFSHRGDVSVTLSVASVND